MNLQIFQVDAFSEEVFGGNPAAVCPLKNWLPDEVLQQIAAENNLSETAFFTKEDDYFHLRWFTPETEVELCGHATLATAHVLFEHLDFHKNTVIFHTKGGMLYASKSRDFISINLPTRPTTQVPHFPDWLENIQLPRPKEVFISDPNWVFLYDSEAEILALEPDFERLKHFFPHGLIVTAKGEKVDFVSRFFAPAIGVNEDPVTGSAHSTLVPFWSERLQKKSLRARQLSKRGGLLFCQYLKKDDRILISGKAVTYLKGSIFLKNQHK